MFSLWGLDFKRYFASKSLHHSDALGLKIAALVYLVQFKASRKPVDTGGRASFTEISPLSYDVTTYSHPKRFTCRSPKSHTEILNFKA